MKKLASTLALIATLNITQATGSDGSGWFRGIVQGVDTLVTVSMHIFTILNDYEDSRMVTTIDDYRYFAGLKYSYPDLYYFHSWICFRTQSGAYQYRYQFFANGQLIIDSADPFQLGTSGQPLCKRKWKCSVHTQQIWYDAESEGSVKFRTDHIVDKQATYFMNVPTSYMFELKCLGVKLAAVCGTADGPAQEALYSGTVSRKGSKITDVTALNLVIEDWYARLKPANGLETK